MYDVNTGKVTIINGARGCEVSGNPRPILGFDNFCLECAIEDFDGGVQKTVLIPVVPVPLEKSISIRGRENIGITDVLLVISKRITTRAGQQKSGKLGSVSP